MHWLLPLHLLAVLVAPGVLLLRYTPLRRTVSAAVRLPLAVAASIFCAYLIGMGLWLLGLKTNASRDTVEQWHMFLAGGYGLMLLAAASPLRQWMRHRPTRRMALATGLLIAWFSLLTCLPRIFAGGMWAIDWLEHIDRARFFRNGLPLDHQFLGLYSLPARPPVVNVLLAHFMELYGTLPTYQLAMGAINLTVVLPVMLWARYFGGVDQRRAVWVVAAVLALSPMVAVNTLFAWTKLATGTFVLLGVYLCYVEFIRRRAAWRPEGFILGYAVQAVGILVHYSAAPFALVTGLMFLARPWWKTGRGWTTLAAILATCTAIMLTWLLPSIMLYGAKDTFASNTTVIDTAQQTPWQNIEKVAANVWASIVPHPLTNEGRVLDAKLIQPNLWTYLRDYYHHICQTVLPTMVGATAGVLLVVLILRERVPVFWQIFLPAVVLLGIAVHGTVTPAGVAHICLQPVALLGIAYMAGRAGCMPQAYRALWMLGIAVDVLLGLWLALYCLTLVPPGVDQVPVGQADVAGFLASLDRNVLEANNWSNKSLRGFTLLGDGMAAYQPLTWTLVIAGTIAWGAVLAFAFFRREPTRRTPTAQKLTSRLPRLG
jgi:hypothetical protein